MEIAALVLDQTQVVEQPIVGPCLRRPDIPRLSAHFVPQALHLIMKPASERRHPCLVPLRGLLGSRGERQEQRGE